jgi:hypothetical protein
LYCEAVGNILVAEDTENSAGPQEELSDGGRLSLRTCAGYSRIYGVVLVTSFLSPIKLNFKAFDLREAWAMAYCRIST